MRIVPLASLILACSIAIVGCGDDAAPRIEPVPMVAGPYAGVFDLAEDTWLRLPPAQPMLGPGDQGRFYWFAPAAAGGSVTFEIRAETTALAAGSVVHRVVEQVGEGQSQGFFSVSPRSLSEGGARHVGGRQEWLGGVYSTHLSSEGSELASGLFEVARGR